MKKVNTCQIQIEQESPPAWTQEAYRPPRSKCSYADLSRGVPHLGERGYPILCPGGYPIPGPGEGGGYPIQGLGGTRSHVWRETLSQVWGLGYPIPCPGGTLSHVRGVPHPRSGQRVPGVPLPDLRWGTPSQTWDGVPPGQTWDEVPPPARPGIGYPPLLSRPGRGTSPPQMLTDRHLWKQYLPVILRMRAVTIQVVIHKLQGSVYMNVCLKVCMLFGRPSVILCADRLLATANLQRSISSRPKFS